MNSLDKHPHGTVDRRNSFTDPSEIIERLFAKAKEAEQNASTRRKKGETAAADFQDRIASGIRRNTTALRDALVEKSSRLAISKKVA